MTFEDLFHIANLVALAGWLLLALAPVARGWADRLAGYALPLLLSALYTGLVLAYWSRAEGGFGSLPDVMRLLARPEIALAGWVHYLAFDLFIGGWQVRTARNEQLPHVFVVPCLALTFLFGPAGLLAFLALRLSRTLAQQATSTTMESEEA
jgi:hypothetical protein